MTFTLVMLIVLTVVVAVVSLTHQSAQERERREQQKREQLREEYLAMVRAKYELKGLPMGFRRRIDFTGERPLSSMELEGIKSEILRG